MECEVEHQETIEVSTDDTTKLNKDHTSKLHRCSECGLINSSSWALTLHMRRHNNVRPAKCDYCPASFINNSELKNHMVIHTKEKRFKCQFCSKSFLNNCSRHNHEDSHGILVHKCKYCQEEFNSRAKRRIHQKSHSKEGLTCEFCSKKFANEEFLKKHHDIHHANNLKSKSTKSTHSDIKSIINDDNYSKANFHQERSNEFSIFHDSDLKLSSSFFTCGICSETFLYRSDLTKHLDKDHTSDEKDSIYKFKCSECDKSFDTMSKLRNHLVIHGVKKYKCEHCDYSTTGRHSLMRHFDSKHSTQKKFKCSHCDLYFTTYNSFVRHKLRHADRKYRCDLCNKYYYTRSVLSQHKREVHNTNPLVCEHCGKVFKYKRHLRVHQKNSHDINVVCRCNSCDKEIFSHEIASHRNSCSEDNKINILNIKPIEMICTACDVTFCSKGDLTNHLKKVHSNNAFSCHLCSKTYSSPKLLKSHLKKSHIVDERICKEYINASLINETQSSNNHYQIHSLYIYECFVCGDSYKNKLDLDSHVMKHSKFHKVCVTEENSKFIRSYNIDKVFNNNDGTSMIVNNFKVSVISKF